MFVFVLAGEWRWKFQDLFDQLQLQRADDAMAGCHDDHAVWQDVCWIEFLNGAVWSAGFDVYAVVGGSCGADPADRTESAELRFDELYEKSVHG